MTDLIVDPDNKITTDYRSSAVPMFYQNESSFFRELENACHAKENVIDRY
jgi:hypothetical protein